VPDIDVDALADARDALVLRGDLSMLGTTLMLREERNGELLNVVTQIRRFFDRRRVCVIVVPIPISQGD
jgi:hypothetical protein